MLSGTIEAERLIETWATPEDGVGAARRHDPARKHDFLLTRAALREILYEMTERNHWSFRADAKGKPLAISLAGDVAPHISLSHTKGMIAVAVSMRHPVGIDIEKWRVRDFAALAAYAFTSFEADHVAHEGQTAFYRLWTMKEAQAKALGIGVLAALEENISAQAGWGIFYEEPCAGYSLSIATKI